MLLVNQQTFQHEVLDASQQVPVLVDFFGEWCGPCKTLAPWLDQLADTLQGKIKIVKVDDKNTGLVQQYGVRAYPTIILFKDGQPVGQNQGLPPSPAALRQLIEPYL